MIETLYWMNSFIKDVVSAKNNFYKKFFRESNNMYHLCAFKILQNYLNQSIQIAKQNYVNKIAQRLGDLMLEVSATGYF